MVAILKASIHEIRTLADFGLLVLIWLVQLIIYPGFRYVSSEDFQAWHSRYTFLISLFVVPLMLGQAVIVMVQLILFPSWPVVCVATLLVLVWLNTFFQAVPAHNQLAAGRELAQTIERLIRVNWIRTLLWTLIFGFGLLRLS